MCIAILMRIVGGLLQLLRCKILHSISLNLESRKLSAVARCIHKDGWSLRASKPFRRPLRLIFSGVRFCADSTKRRSDEIEVSRVYTNFHMEKNNIPYIYI